jgi:acyl-CoA dehydrogenase
MDLSVSARAQELLAVVRDFMNERVIPAEPVYTLQRAELAAAGRLHDVPPIMTELIEQARGQELWNLFLPDVSGLTNVDYAVLAEETGRSPILGPAAMNCLSPDSGNMELLHMFGTDEQKSRWLDPLLEGQIRSGFSMTEPDVASSDATNISTTITRDGDDYLVNGRKWWTTGAADPRCRLLIVMGRSNPGAARHQQHSMILVPIDTPGVRVVRVLPVFGFLEQQGHCEISYEDVRVPADSLLGDEGAGFAIAQARLGPGRIHHCMRAIGGAERALEMMCRRANERVTFGGPLADKQMVQDFVARSRIEIDAARLLCLHAAWKIDTVGKRAARQEIAEIKVLAAQVYMDVLDRAIQVHGALGVSDDTPLARMWREGRALRLGDGPDEVHKMTIARRELARWRAQPAS